MTAVWRGGTTGGGTHVKDRGCSKLGKHKTRMSETPTEPEPQLSVQPLLQQSQLHAGLQLLQLSESNIQYQHRVKSMWIKHQKLLFFLCGFSLCAVILGLIYYVHHDPHTDSNNCAVPVTPCLSPACQMASAHLCMSTDPFTQPCDYFLFTCGSDRYLLDGGWTERGQGVTGQTEESEKEDRGFREHKTLNRKDVLLQYFKEILETDNRTNSSAVQKTKGFYHSCLDTKAIESAGAEPFLTLIQKLGGWAVSDKWNKPDFNTTLGLLMRDYDTFPFFSVYVGKDPNEVAHGMNKTYIQIDQPDLLIPIEWNSETEKSKAKTEALRPFFTSCARYLNLLGAPPESSLIHVGTFISLSSQLALAVSPLHYRLSKGQLHQRMTIKELQRQAPAIDWLGCLQTAFHPLSLSEDDHVLLHNLPYVMAMSRIIFTWLKMQEPSTSAPLHTFMVFNLLHTLMPAMDSRFSETARNFSLALGHTEEEDPRWKHCVQETKTGFDLVFTHLLSQRTAQKEAEEIIENVFYSFKSKLHELKLADQTSIQAVMEKVNTLIPKLWTIKQISSEAELDLLFSKVAVSKNSFFSNYVQLLSLRQKRRNKLLTTQTEAVDILSVTPFLLGNKLLFPMGMFVPPLFHPTYPRAMTYGASGFLIAKDILHLFLPEIYSRNETVHAVEECVWAHYLAVRENAGRGGALSLSAAQQQEVWVQYSALQVALQAYRQSLKQQPGDTSLSWLSYTHLFFRSFSQVKCDVDPYNEAMPFDPSFLSTVICAKYNICPTSLQCSIKTQQDSLQAC